MRKANLSLDGGVTSVDTDGLTGRRISKSFQKGGSHKTVAPNLKHLRVSLTWKIDHGTSPHGFDNRR